MPSNNEWRNRMLVALGGSNKNNFARYLDTDGDGTGTYNAIGDYSSAKEEFYIQPKTGQVLQLNRIMITIEDGGSIDSGGYGNNSSPLTNGIRAIVRQPDVDDIVLTAQVNVKRTADWNSLCYDGNVADFGSGNSFYVSRWTFTKDGDPIILSENDKFIIELNDDFSGSGQALVGHRFLIKGKILSEV